MPRAAAPKPTGPDGENLTQWAIKIVVKFHEDCENGMHVYSGELKNALSIDGYPLSSLPTLYTQDRKYRQQFGVDAITTAVKNEQKAKKAKLAQSPAAAAEVDEQCGGGGDSGRGCRGSAERCLCGACSVDGSVRR